MDGETGRVEGYSRWGGKSGIDNVRDEIERG